MLGFKFPGGADEWVIFYLNIAPHERAVSGLRVPFAVKGEVMDAGIVGGSAPIAHAPVEVHGEVDGDDTGIGGQGVGGGAVGLRGNRQRNQYDGG